MKIILLLAFSLLASLLFTDRSSAHVLITDTTKTNGAILHIQPDDDPIAGQSSHIFYDVQKIDTQQSTLLAKLTVTNVTNNDTVVVPISIDDKGISADYTFPMTGVYTLKLNVSTSKQSINFEYSQRVSRGENSSGPIAASHTWAEGILIGSGVGILTMILLIMNYNTRIKALSTF